MDAKHDPFIDRLWDQVLYWNPNNIEQKQCITKKLQEQLVDGRAVVKIKTLEVEYDELHKSCESKIYELKRILERTNDTKSSVAENCNSDNECKEQNVKDESCPESDSSDNERLSVIAKKSQQSISEADDLQPLALRRAPRMRKKSRKLKYNESDLQQPPKQSRTKKRRGHPTIYCCEEDAVCNVESRHSLHIEIPRLFLQGSMHHLYLGHKLSEKTFEDKASNARSRVREKYTNSPTQQSKQNQSELETVVTTSYVSNIQATPEEVEFSDFVREIMPGNGSEDEETWRAASALECINNNVLDNLDRTVEQYRRISQSSHEAPLCCEPATSKKRRKLEKPVVKSQPKKRGRKPKNKNAQMVQPPTKSNLAQYVENFSNDCAMPGSVTPAGSSTMSQPLVSSTTHNYEFIDQQDSGTVMCYIEGDWANGGSCQLVTTNGMNINGAQLQTENTNESTVTFQDNVSIK